MSNTTFGILYSFTEIVHKNFFYQNVGTIVCVSQQDKKVGLIHAILPLFQY